MKHPAEILLKILLNGGEIEYEGFTYCIIDEQLCVHYGDGVVILDCTVGSFINMANKIGKNELWLKACALKLRNYERKTRDFSKTN